MALRRGRLRSTGGRIALSVGLLGLGLWMLQWGLERHALASRSYAQQQVAAQAGYPEALVRLGEEAWMDHNVSGARRFFQQAVRQDRLQLGAWLSLAQVEKTVGNAGQARKILDYVHEQGRRTLRWTWAETLLALDLEAHDLAWDNLNRLIQHHRQTRDALQLADVLLTRDLWSPDAAAARLEPPNLRAYLAWLIQWKRLDEALGVQAKMAQTGIRDPELKAWLSARLVAQKRVPEALALGGAHMGEVNNPGFEKAVSKGGFDWRLSNRRDQGWRIQPVEGTAKEGRHSLQVTFTGEQNCSFAHLSQVVPVTPGRSYRLTAWWKGEGLSTDQGPFLEIYGYDAKGLRVRGPMLSGTRDWEEVSLDFSVPQECHAVVIRLRRLPSRKLDNKIKGRMWVDDFRLSVISRRESDH